MTHVIVTRPTREAGHWVRALQAEGWQAVALPLIDMAAPSNGQALERCRQQWHGYDAVMFVSAQAVRGLFPEGNAENGVARCWAPGPGTARALLQAGVPAERIDAPAAGAAQFDSEALWATVVSQVRPGFRLLVVRGETVGAGASQSGHGREWLAQQCLAAGGQVDWCVAYQRRVPCWSAAEQQAALAHACDGSVWLFSSSEAVSNLAQLCPNADWQKATALVTHTRIAEAAQRLGFGAIITTRPALADVLQSLSSLS